jgi:hypothetical protein
MTSRHCGQSLYNKAQRSRSQAPIRGLPGCWRRSTASYCRRANTSSSRFATGTVDLNRVVLQSSILDYSQTGNAVGLLPTLAADAWFHKKVTVSPSPSDLHEFMKVVERFARGPYAAALAAFPKVDAAVLDRLSEFIGIPPVVVKYWRLDLSTGMAPCSSRACFRTMVSPSAPMMAVSPQRTRGSQARSIRRPAATTRR